MYAYIHNIYIYTHVCMYIYIYTHTYIMCIYICCVYIYTHTSVVVTNYIINVSPGFGKYFNNLINPGFVVFFEIVELTLKLVWTNSEIVELLWKLVWKLIESCVCISLT